MKINVDPPKSLMFNSFFIMFVVHSAQTGVGIAGLPRIVFLEAGNDAWISILIAGIMLTISTAIIVLLLKNYESADLYGIHKDLFGKWIGSFFSLIYIGYMVVITYLVIMHYTEMVQAWIFPQMPTWLLSALLIFLGVYAVLGGVRIIVGLSFMAFILTAWLIFVIYAPLKYMDYTHYFPIMDHSWKELGMGTYKTAFSVIGFELLLLLYPYVKDKKKVLKFSLFGIAYTTFIYFVVTFVSIGFFSEMTLEKTIWPVLSMFKIVRIPNLERFEFIAVSYWMLVILPNICLYLWAATRGVKRVFGFKQKKAIYLFAVLLWISTFFIDQRIEMNTFTDKVATVSFGLTFIYPSLLLGLVLIKKFFKKKKGESL
ncbi:GerAB/ArcD/ProY family transporter [Rossellomorea vietnamensis]|uniref:GerAB/ArcD/ProY family transporter n=1 Tax=Rossellomorea vietnamensis TaxID=218284 RepID=A0A5D4MID0_9BACI|nr:MULTISPECIES: GerAB/ArcD/ProY family transporter [Bacillaceae]TYS01503.1 GerAB/ArcD/ProY family transporter [Rossellomorea vietnamensis]